MSRDTATRALVVDDDAPRRRALQLGLQRHGVACETAFDGPDALGWALGGSFDVIVAESSAPRPDGLSAITSMRARGRLEDTPVIAIGDRPKGAGTDVVVRRDVAPAALADEARRLRDETRRFRITRGHKRPSTDPLVFDGRLDGAPLSDVCRAVHVARRTGALAIERSEPGSG